MPKLNVPPTKSNLLALKRQLAFAQEGYDLLEQKRQILVFEMMSRLERARGAELRVEQATSNAHAALQDAELDVGSDALDRAAIAVRLNHSATLSSQPLMGLRIPKVKQDVERPGVQFGFVGTSASTDRAMARFVELLPALAELAELENAVIRLARELRKTQRRCNALSKIFIPAHRETIGYISAALEEREREFLTVHVLKKKERNSAQDKI